MQKCCFGALGFAVVQDNHHTDPYACSDYSKMMASESTFRCNFSTKTKLCWAVDPNAIILILLGVSVVIVVNNSATPMRQSSPRNEFSSLLPSSLDVG